MNKLCLQTMWLETAAVNKVNQAAKVINFGTLRGIYYIISHGDDHYWKVASSDLTQNVIAELWLSPLQLMITGTVDLILIFNSGNNNALSLTEFKPGSEKGHWCIYDVDEEEAFRNAASGNKMLQVETKCSKWK